MQLWGGELDDSSWQASENLNAQPGVVYTVSEFWNGIGRVNGISSGRVGDCTVKFMSNNGDERCVLPEGNYTGGEFVKNCGNDVVAQYEVVAPGKMFVKSCVYAKASYRELYICRASCFSKTK